MSEQREALAAVLAEHVDRLEYLSCYCSCQDAPLDVTWEQHLADVLLREWLPGALADERVVEAAAVELQPAAVYPPFRIALARAALTAAVTALTEDDA